MATPPEGDYFARARTLYNVRDLDRAEEFVALALARSPGRLGPAMLRARIFEARKDLTGAAEQYRKLCAAFPESPSPPAELSRLTMDTGDFELAERSLDKAAALGLPRDRLMRLRIRAAARKGDVAREMELLAELLNEEEQPTLARLVRLAQLQAKSRDWASALATAQWALARSPAEASALIVAADAAAELGDDTKARGYLEKLVSLDPGNAVWTARLLRYLAKTGEVERAAQLFRSALDRLGDASHLHHLSLVLKLPPELVERSILWAEAVDGKASDRDRSVAVELLMRFSRPMPPGLVEGLGDSASRIADLERWLHVAPSDAELKRPVVEDDMGEVIVARGLRPAATVLVFTGLADQLHVPLFIYDRYLAALNVDAVYLRDHSRYVFNNGIASVAGDLAGTVDYLRGLLADEGGRPTAAIGTSAGGFAAIRYGLALRTRRIICFSAPTNLSQDFLADEGRALLTIRRLKTLPERIADTRPFVRDAGGRTAIHLYYGARMPLDERHARHLEGEPGVTLHPLPDVDVHGIVKVLASTGELLGVLRRHLLGS